MVTMSDANGGVRNGASPLGHGVASAGMWSLSGSLVLLLATVIATPFTIRLLGPANYGLWSLLQSVLAYAALADLGMATASTKIAAEDLARDRTSTPRKRRRLHSARSPNDSNGEVSAVYTSLLITVGVTSLLAAVVGLEAGNLLGLFHINVHQRSEGVGALRIICAISVCNAVIGILNTPQIIRLRWRPYTAITTGAGVIGTVGAPVVLRLFGGGIEVVSIVVLFASCVAVVGNLILAVRLQPALRHIHIDRETMHRLLSYGIGLTISGIAAIPLNTAERFFLAHNRSTATVAYYAVAASLGATLMVIPQALIQPLVPALVRLRSQSRILEYRQLCSRGLRMLVLVMIPAAIIGSFLAHPFLSLWAGKVYGVRSTGPFLILLCGVVCNGLAYVPFAHLLATGRTAMIARIHLLELPCYLVMAAVLTARYGSIGAALSWTARVVADSIIYYAVARRTDELGGSSLDWLRGASLIPPAVLGVGMYVCAIFVGGLGPRLLVAAGVGGVYAAVVWRAVLDDDDKRTLLRLAGH